MSYALATLWHDRQRFLPGVLAVAFSALLIALQCGLLLGLFSITSLPIDETRAHVWVGHPEVPSVDLGRPIPSDWQSFLSMPEVVRTEMFVQTFQYWSKPTGGAELCLIIGSRLGDDALGAVKLLSKEDRALLTEPGAVIVDESEFERLGIQKVGDTAEVKGNRVKVVATIQGYKSLAGPFIFCSLDTAHKLVGLPKEQSIFILAECRSPQDARKVVEHFQQPAFQTKLSAFTSEEFSLRSRLHWLTKTKAGIALGCAAALGLLVGAVVTSQTLYAATLAQLREYAVLRAMGIPRWRMSLAVLAQSFWVGVAGVVLSLPTVFALGQLANQLGAKVQLPWELLTFAVGITMFMAMISGLTALRSLRQVEPVTLLR